MSFPNIDLLLPKTLMSTERRTGTLRTYVTKVKRVDGQLQKRYIGRSADPVIHLLTADHQLALADRRARRKKHQTEIELDKKLAETFVRVEAWSANWKVIHRLTLLPQPKVMKNPKADVRSSKLPALHRFLETCRLVNGGDQDAIRQLNSWLAEIPGHLSEATDLLAIAESQLIKLLSPTGSPETEALVRRNIAQTSADLQSLVKGDPLAKMHADAVAIAWLDFMRCQLAAIGAYEDTKTANYWNAAADRALRRWGRVEEAFGEYRKHWHRQPK